MGTQVGEDRRRALDKAPVTIDEQRPLIPASHKGIDEPEVPASGFQPISSINSLACRARRIHRLDEVIGIALRIEIVESNPSYNLVSRNSGWARPIGGIRSSVGHAHAARLRRHRLLRGGAG